jgi:hypothetical protein
MNASFSLTLPFRFWCVKEYPRVLEKVPMKQIAPAVLGRVSAEVLLPNVANESELIVRNRRAILLASNLPFRAVMFCAFTHPVTYAQFGRLPNWYDTASCIDLLTRREPLFTQMKLSTLEEMIQSRLPFIQKIQDPKFKPSITEGSFVRYEKFMTLVKMYETRYSLTPPDDVDIIWHAHMLNHAVYVRDTKRYFRSIIERDDTPRDPAYLFQRENITKILWEKHFPGSPYHPPYIKKPG